MSMMNARASRPELSVAVGSPSPLSFFLIYVVTGVGLWLASRGGYYMLVAPLAVTFVAVPILDALMGVDRRNPDDAPPGAAATAMLRLATALAVPAQTSLLVWGALFATRPATSTIELVGVVVAVGTTGGALGITVAHELIHRASRLDRALGGVLLTLVFYLHWATEHVAGHHRRVATPEDPATARLGEALPAFMVRSVALGLVSAWRIEAARRARRGKTSPLHNGVVFCVLASCGLTALFAWALGPRAALFFVAQSAVAIAFLETINYVEHYGLERRMIRPGVYERVTPVHSWNAAHWLTNALLFNLQRHSDHHAWPARPYYRLRQHPNSPQLPAGYATMALLAMVPPLWRRVMDPRVHAHRARLQSMEAPVNEAEAP